MPTDTPRDQVLVELASLRESVTRLAELADIFLGVDETCSHCHARFRFSVGEANFLQHAIRASREWRKDHHCERSSAGLR